MFVWKYSKGIILQRRIQQTNKRRKIYLSNLECLQIFWKFETIKLGLDKKKFQITEIKIWLQTELSIRIRNSVSFDWNVFGSSIFNQTLFSIYNMIYNIFSIILLFVPRFNFLFLTFYFLFEKRNWKIYLFLSRKSTSLISPRCNFQNRSEKYRGFLQ